MENNQPSWWSVGFARKAEHRQTHFRCVGAGSTGPEGGAGIGCVVQGGSKNCAIRPLVPSRSDLSSPQKPNLVESKEIDQGWQGSPGMRNAWMPQRMEISLSDLLVRSVAPTTYHVPLMLVDAWALQPTPIR